LFVILSLACNLSGAGNNADQGRNDNDGGETSEGETLKPTEDPNVTTFMTEDGQEVKVPNPPPDAFDLILSRVEEGEYTLEEAVLAGLQIYAGQESDLNLFGDQETQHFNLWRLSTYAAQVYQDADPDTQAQIEQFFRVIAPTSEAMDRYAAPAEQALDSSAKLASPVYQVDCGTIWEEGFPDIGDPVQCLLYYEFTEGGHRYRVYFPYDQRDDPNTVAYADAALQGLRDSIRVYSPLAELRDINVIFTAILPPDEPEDTQAAVPDLFPDEISSAPCPVLVYPATIAEGTPDDKFQQVIAHEVFHCIEYWRQGTTSGSAVDWYIEGMAEYFSGVVYPNANNEHDWLAGFNIISATDSIIDMKYESWVFFQYLGNNFGKDFVIHMLDVLPRSGSKSGQISALAGIGDMPTTFHDFGQQFLDRQLQDENGSALPFDIYYLPSSMFFLEPGGPAGLEAAPFQISRYFLGYVEAKDYLITRDDGGSGSFTARPESGGWGDLPLDITTPCDPLFYKGLLTTTNPSDSFEITLESTFEKELECDPCLVGIWQQDPSEFSSNLSQIMSGSGMTIVSVEGVLTLDITESQIKLTPEGVVVKFQDPDGKIIAAAMSGYNIAAYAVVEEGIIGSYDVENGLVLTMEVAGFSMDMPVPGGIGFSLEDGGTFPYTCTDTTLTAIPPADAGFDASTFIRISPPPEH
jgi:hypothetical protein